VVRRVVDEKVVRTPAEVDTGDLLRVRLADGELRATVTGSAS